MQPRNVEPTYIGHISPENLLTLTSCSLMPYDVITCRSKRDSRHSHARQQKKIVHSQLHTVSDLDSKIPRSNSHSHPQFSTLVYSRMKDGQSLWGGE